MGKAESSSRLLNYQYIDEEEKSMKTIKVDLFQYSKQTALLIVDKLLAEYKPLTNYKKAIHCEIRQILYFPDRMQLLRIAINSLIAFLNFECTLEQDQKFVESQSQQMLIQN